MKLCLHCGNKPRPEYENFDSRYEFVETKGVQASVDDYQFAEFQEGSIEEILAGIGSIESIRRERLVGIAKRWFNLLQEDGLLKIDTFDIYTVTNNFLYDRMDMNQFESVCSKFKSFHCYQTVRELFQSVGFKFRSGSYVNDYSSIMFEKPKGVAGNGNGQEAEQQG